MSDETTTTTVSGVTFSFSEFIGLFPHLSEAYTAGTLTESMATMNFTLIGEQFGTMFPYDPDNGVNTRKQAFYYATCHLCTLALWPAGQAGRVASAGQGSVNTSFDLVKANKWLADYWLQTPCGATFWAFTASYRRGGRIYITKEHHPYG